MKCTIPEISWHNRDPILSVDIQPIYNEEFYRLASGGTDCHVLIWYLKIRKNGAVDVDIVSDLSRHQRAVNAVRWSPSGQYLATGDDDANIIVWNLKTDNIPLLEGETSDKETWLVNKVLRGHKEDVYDICWSPNGMKLISGSIDNTAILWDFTKGLNECILSDHKGFVQGVTWDPKGQFIATLSSDRVCRVFDNTGKYVKSRAHKGLLPLPESHVLFNKEVKYFHDDTFKSYFRRLSFSPDGNLLIAPSGCIESEDYKAVRHTTLVFTLDCLTQPAAVLPSPKQETIAARCCPVLFELHSEGGRPIIDLPYRMVIAVATDSDVVLYDTQQLAPFAHLQKVHYTRITDLAWSSDGLLLIAASTDGYCTLVTFEPNELGVQYVKEESEAEESLLDVSGCEELDKTEVSNKKTKEKEQVEMKLKKPNLLEQWAIRKPKDEILKEENRQNITKEKNNVLLEKPAIAGQECMEVDKSSSGVHRKVPLKAVPKRIAPIKIADIQKNQKPEKSCTSVVKNSEEKKIVSSSMSKDNTKKENVTNKTTKQEVDCSNNDAVVIDDSSLKENKPELSTHNTDSDSKSSREPSTQKKKEKPSDTTPSRKRRIETKINTPNKNSPLLKFFQTAISKPEPKQENADISKTNNKKISHQAKIPNESTNTIVIEISDDESSDLTITPIPDKISRTNMVNNSSKLDDKGKTLGVIKIDRSHSNTLPNVCDSGNPNIYTGTVSTSETKEEKQDKMHLCTQEAVSMETDEVVCIDDTNPSKKDEKQIAACETENVTDYSKDSTFKSKKQNMETEKISSAGVSNPVKNTEKTNRLQGSTSKSNVLPVKAATPKGPRRIALVTLSSPKRKKKA